MERGEAERIYDAGRDPCVEFLLELSARYEREVTCLEARVARLEEQARQSSRTSSKPPSQDPPKTRAQRRAEAREKAKAWAKGEGERKPGGQPGHAGAGRELLPEDQVDDIVAHYPDRCQGCGHELGAEEREESGRYGRHQVAELPPLAGGRERAPHAAAALSGAAGARRARRSEPRWPAPPSAPDSRRRW